jgi:malate synthase
VSGELVRWAAGEELERIRREVGNDAWFYSLGRPDDSRRLFERVALADDFVEFLTLPAYERLLELEHEQPPR